LHKNATKCNETQGKWCKNKHEASKIIDTFETYQVGKKKQRTRARVEEIASTTWSSSWPHGAGFLLPPDFVLPLF
jgi:hypothetical protein